MVLDKLLDSVAAAAVSCPEDLRTQEGVIISLRAAVSDLGTPAGLARSPEFQNEMPSLILCFQLSLSLFAF